MEFCDELLEPFGEKLLEMSVPTQLSFKTPLVFRMVKELTKHGCLPWTGSHRAELCCDEALTNAMMHGNKLDPAKKVHVTLFADDERWGAIVEDEGEGFGPESIPDADDPEFLFREAGRGILLMDGYVDELKYNRKAKRLRMVRHRQTEPEEAEAEAALAPGEAAPLGAEPVVTSSDGGIEIIEIAAARVADENIEALREALQASAAKSSFIVLDLSRVEYVSSVGLGTLISAYKQVRSQNGHLMLAAVRPAVMDILESARLRRLFQIEPDRKTAVAALKKLV